MPALRARLAQTPPGYRFTVGRVLAIYGAVMVALLLGALDQTIVATALPRIASELGAFSSYSWVFTSYLLSTTVAVPIYGKLGDIYGRRALFVAAISIFLVGSALCGAAQSMPQLVAFRAVQGLGAGGIFPLALATVGNIIPPRDRGRYQGFIGATFATASIAGPALGGVIADHASWRYVFFLNLPVGVVALAVILLALPRRGERHEHSIDYVGAAVLAGGTSALLLGLVWGGRDHPWTSLPVVGMLAAAAALLALFALVERRAPEPILPFDLLARPNVAASIACMALVGLVMLATISYVPLFVQGVLGTTATSSGIVLMPFMLSAVTTSVASGQWISRTGRYLPNALIGPVLFGVGMFLLARMDEAATRGDVARNLVVAGLGLGLMMQVFVLSVQNNVPSRAIGAATALSQFARSIGSTVGVTLMAVIVNQGFSGTAGGGPGAVRDLAPPVRAELASALQPAFLALALLCVLLFLVVAFGLREVPLRRALDDDVETVRVAREALVGRYDARS